ncbi:MAG: hypothetical protein KDA22_02795, partial [Phycisphaerales bacterium]|nr:hypothetical protein [Phycisphaerales bacterium]
MSPRWRHGPILLTAALLWLGGRCSAQSLEQRLDDEAFVRGLGDLRLRPLLEQLATTPTEDDLRPRRIDVELLRVEATDPERTPAERTASVAQLLDARAALIEAANEDPRQAIWMADQAEDLLFVAIPLDGNDLRATHGTAAPATRHRLAQAAVEAQSLAATARVVAGDSVDRLGDAPDRDPARRRQRSRLVETELAWRIPLLQAVADVLVAEWAVSGDPSSELRRGAAPRLAELARRLSGTSRNAARAAQALALLRLGQGDEAAVVAADLAVDPSATPLDRIRADMLLVECTAVREGAAAALRHLGRIERDETERGGLFAALLMAELRLRLAEQTAPLEEARAYATFEALIERAEATARSGVRAAVLQRLSDAALDRPDRIDASVLVAVAVADRPSVDEPLRARAEAALVRALQEASLTDLDRLLATATTARIQAAKGEVAAETVRELVGACDRAARLPEAGEALEFAAGLAVDLARRSPGAENLVIRDQALAAVLGHTPPVASIDRWRCEAARAALEAGQLDVAMRLAGQVESDPSWQVEAAFLAAAAARDKAIGASGPPAVQAWNAALAAAVRAVGAARRGDTADPSMLDRQHELEVRALVFQAEAELRSGRAEDALATLESIADRASPPPVVAESLRLRIAALQALGRPEDATAVVAAYAVAAPQRAWAVAAALLRTLAVQHHELLAALRDDEADALAREQMAPLAAALEGLLADPRTRPEDQLLDLQLQRLAAESRLAAGQPAAALAAFDRVLRAQPDALEALEGRAECLFALGGEECLAEAMALYKRIAAGCTESANEHFWLAELRMLQILDRVGR